MSGAFWFLARRSLANRVRRMREPRYLVALVIGVLYILAVFSHPGRPALADPDSTLLPTLAPLLGSIGIAVGVAFWWVVGSDRRALAFSPAEVQFLFPAPLDRRALIGWKLLRSQALILVNAIIWVLLVRRTDPPIALPLYLLAFWTVFSTLHMHRLGAALTRAQAGARWRTGGLRLGIALSLVLIGVVGIALPLIASRATLSGLCCGRPFWEFLSELLREPPASVVLLPFRLVLGPLAATTAAEWVTWMIPALGLLAAHYVWVARTSIAFEETALIASAEQARRLSRRDPSLRLPIRRRLLPGLSPGGSPEVAFIWKNLHAVLRGAFPTATVVGVLAVGIAAGVSAGSLGRGWSHLVGSAALVTLGFLVLWGPLWVQNDLRQDLGLLPQLRGLPVSGRRIVTGEIAAAVLSLTLLQLGAGLLTLIGFREQTGELWRTPAGSAVAVFSIPVLVIINALGYSVHNAGALLFPAWVRSERGRPGGFETLGQNTIVSLLTLTLIVLSLLPPLAVAILAGDALGSSSPRMAWNAAAATFVLAAGLELYLALGWLGRLFERGET